MICACDSASPARRGGGHHRSGSEPDKVQHSAILPFLFNYGLERSKHALEGVRKVTSWKVWIQGCSLAVAGQEVSTPSLNEEVNQGAGTTAI